MSSFRSAQSSEQRHLHLFRKLSEEWMLAPGIAFYLILFTIQDLFAIVARIQPGIRLSYVAHQRIRSAKRFRQIDGIVHNGKIRDPVATPDEVLRQRRFVTLRHSVRANPAALEMSRG